MKSNIPKWNMQIRVHMSTKRRKARILVVDDDEVVRNIVSFALPTERFMVEEASNGQEAVDKVKQNKPDIILLDAVMPVMDGVQTYRRLKEDAATRDIPIIFCTATHMAEMKEGKAEIDDYIEKPFSIDDLCRKIYRILEHKRKRR